MSVARVIRLLAAAAAVLALSSCSKSSLEAPGTTVKNPVFESAPLVAGTIQTGPLTGSKDIDGAIGGRLSVGSYRIEVPPGAFKGLATITITQSDPSILKCDLAIVPASANQFAVPVTLVARLPNSAALDTDQNMWLDPSADSWRLLPSTADAGKIELRSDIWHFSTYGTGRAGW